MRAFRLLVGPAILLSGLYLYFALVRATVTVADHPLFGKPGPLAIAHQGGRGLWPENTLYAFEQAVALGVDVLEMDLRSTADGSIIVMHDGNVDRTTDGAGPVSELTLERVRALDAGYRFEDEDGQFRFRGAGLRVPRLEEVLERFPDTGLNLEMKDFRPEAARRFCSLLRASGRTERVLVASFGYPSMRAFRDACPEVATSATLREGLLFYYANRVGLGSLYRSPAVAFEFPEYFGDIHVIQPSFLQLARSVNVRVQVWTVNDVEDMKRLLGMGVDGIVTDYPDRLLRLLGRNAP